MSEYYEPQELAADDTMLELNKVYQGDCIDLMKQIDDDSIDAIITDPPYGLEFMGKEWDSFNQTGTSRLFHSPNKETDKGFGAKEFGTPIKNLPRFLKQDMVAFQSWTTQWATEALRILKPGGFLFSMGGTRTYHRMTCGVEDAGFTIKDCVLWCYASGFPKAQSIDMLIEKKLGGKGEDTGIHNPNERPNCTIDNTIYESGTVGKEITIKKPTLEEAKQWSGWKTPALKPAYEPIVIAQKPCDGSITENVMKHSVGGFNVDECRIPFESLDDIKSATYGGYIGEHIDHTEGKFGMKGSKNIEANTKGRFPANIITTEPDVFGGGYDRFFFVPKASRSEKNKGLDSFEEKSATSLKFNENSEFEGRRSNNVKHRNIHPTVKPIKLFSWLITLATTKDAIILDPFLGSGTTAIACEKLGRKWIGIEQSEEYIKIAEARIKYYSDQAK